MKRLSLLLLVASLALTLIMPSASALAQTELVVNGSLDSYDGSGLASGWTRWWEEVPNPNNGDLNYAGKPDWGGESNPALVLGGLSQHIGATWNPWRAGIYQTITAPPNTRIRVSASGRVFASNDNFPSPSDGAVPVVMQIGADPTGGTEWWSGNIQWSGIGGPHDTWQTFTVEVTTGTSGKATIFLLTNYKGHSRLHLDAWWDNVTAQAIETVPTATNTLAPVTEAPTSLVANPTATTAPATPLPAATDSATATLAATTAPTVAASATPGFGMICVTIYEDANGNGLRDADEILVADTSVGLDGVPGNNNPHCFEGVASGQHTLTAKLPSGYFSTTGDQQLVNLQGGRTDVMLGAQSNRIAAPPATPTPQPETPPSIVPAVLGVGTVLVLVIGVVIAVILVRSRRG
jgi:hypothetical protein